MTPKERESVERISRVFKVLNAQHDLALRALKDIASGHLGVDQARAVAKDALKMCGHEQA